MQNLAESPRTVVTHSAVSFTLHEKMASKPLIMSVCIDGDVIVRIRPETRYLGL